MKPEKTTTYTTYCGPFDKIEVTDNVNVVYECRQDSAGYLTYSGAHRFADAFILNNNKGKLKIQVNTEDVNDPELPDNTRLFKFPHIRGELFGDEAGNQDNRTLLQPEHKANRQRNHFRGRRKMRPPESIARNRKRHHSHNRLGRRGKIRNGGDRNHSGRPSLRRRGEMHRGRLRSDRMLAHRIDKRQRSRLHKVYYRGDPVVKKGPGLKLFRIGGNKGSSSTYEDDEPVPDETPAQEELSAG